MAFFKIKLFLIIFISKFFKLIKKKKITNNFLVLLYHSLKEKAYKDEKGIYNLEREKFFDHLNILKENKFTIKKFNEINYTGKEVLITFDDGYKSIYDLIINNEINFPVILFICPKFLNSNDYRFMNIEMLKKISKYDFVEIGSHSYSHANLISLSDHELMRELSESKVFLENIIKKKVEYFSIPFGIYNKNIINKIELAGYKAAFTSNYGRNIINKNKYVLNRIDIWSFDNHASFSQKIDLQWEWLKKINVF